MWTWKDLPEVVRNQRLPLYVPNPAIKQVRMQHMLAKDEVCIVGDPVAVVIADDRYIAEDAATLVEVDWEILEPVADVRSAFENPGITAHSDAPDNVVARVPMKYGDIDAAFARAPHVFKDRIFQHRGGPFFIETRGLVATYDEGSHSLTAHVSCQGAHRLKRSFMDMFDLGDNQVRVIAPEVVAHGLGNALLERLVHDDNANPVSTSFAEYLMPMATDMPDRVELLHTETPSPLNPLGVKGAGEGGTIAAIAAIVGAVENALSPFGVRISEVPLSPQRVVELVTAPGKARNDETERDLST